MVSVAAAPRGGRRLLRRRSKRERITIANPRIRGVSVREGVNPMTDYDIIIKDGTIVDGTRTPRYVSDIAIKDGKITQIGGLKGKTAARVLDAAGRIVAP